MTYKEVCGNESCVWFSLTDMKIEGRKFLQWAKDLGCVWLNGEEINSRKGTDFFHLSIHADGKLSNVAMYAWVAPQYANVKRVRFSEFIAMSNRRS